MSARERVWYEQLYRRVGVNPVPGLHLDAQGARIAHELLTALAGDDDERAERLGRELMAARVRIEDEVAARLELPPRPR
jgi:hypothetical protein